MRPLALDATPCGVRPAAASADGFVAVAAGASAVVACRESGAGVGTQAWHGALGQAMPPRGGAASALQVIAHTSGPTSGKGRGNTVGGIGSDDSTDVGSDDLERGSNGNEGGAVHTYAYPARLVASQPLPSPLTCVSWSPPLGAADSASVDAGRCSCLLAAVGASRRLDIFRAPTRAELTCDWVRIFDATAALASAADEVLTPTETIASAAGGGAAGAAAQRAAKRARGTPHPGRGRAAARAALCCAWSAAFSRDARGAPASLLAVGTEAGTVLLLRHGVSGDGANQFALAGALRLSESFVTAIEWAGPVPAEGGRIEPVAAQTLVAADCAGNLKAWRMCLDAGVDAVGADARVHASAPAALTTAPCRAAGALAVAEVTPGGSVLVASATGASIHLHTLAHTQAQAGADGRPSISLTHTRDVEAAEPVTALALTRDTAGSREGLRLHAATQGTRVWTLPARAGDDGEAHPADAAAKGDGILADLLHARVLAPAEQSGLKLLQVDEITALAPLPAGAPRAERSEQSALLVLGAPRRLRRILFHNSPLINGFALPLDARGEPVYPPEPSSAGASAEGAAGEG